MALTYGIYLYQQVAALDFVGPYDVFDLSTMLAGEGKVVTVASSLEPIQCVNGMVVQPQYDFATAPDIDILLVPGAKDLEDAMTNEAGLKWIQDRSAKAQYTTAVCTGALILQHVGLLKNKRATTHWQLVEELNKAPDTEVMPEMRYVRDDNIVTAQGISAGIDMALWLVGQLHSPQHAREVRKILQYDPAPPYTAEV